MRIGAADGIRTAPIDQAARLAELRALNLLDNPRESHFDRLTVPMVFLTLVDGDRQWFKSTYGITVETTPRDVGFCAHAMLEPGSMAVPDATEDARFADNPLVAGDFNLRLYAGAPLHGPGGRPVGALSLVDTRPREFSPRQRDDLLCRGRGDGQPMTTATSVARPA